MKKFGELSREEKESLIIAAYIDKKPIEVAAFNPVNSKETSWRVTPKPIFYEGRCYRIKETPDSINWDHVSPKYNYMTRHSTGQAHLWGKKPILCHNFWQPPHKEELVAPAFVLSSYKKGTVHWTESLVCRPGFEKEID